MKARKKPIAVPVVFASRDGVLRTVEGPVAYRAGDALMTGVKGERWPVRRDEFAERYVPAGGQAMFVDGDYLKRPVVVDAERMDAPFSVSLGDGNVLAGQAGDWLITGTDGEQWVVAGDVFAETYVRVD